MEETKLTSTVTVKAYREFKANEDREKIANIIFERFFERYIDPFESNKSKHGFSMMAVSCLMIEALFCFERGRKRAGEKGGEVFENFFSSSSKLKMFVGNGLDFYSNVRCGILHQGETYDGWKILRKGPLFDPSSKTINATKFMKALKAELQEYVDDLKVEPFKGKKWQKAIKKLGHICKNCIA